MPATDPILIKIIGSLIAFVGAVLCFFMKKLLDSNEVILSRLGVLKTDLKHFEKDLDEIKQEQKSHGNRISNIEQKIRPGGA